MKTFFITIAIVAIIGLALFQFILLPLFRKDRMPMKVWGGISAARIAVILGFSSIYYAEPVKKVLTARQTDVADENSETATATDNSALVRFNDNVRARVSSTTRFRLPEDPELFLRMANDYRSQSNLVHNSILPFVDEVVRNSARELSAQSYITGEGGQFESNVEDQLINGTIILKIIDKLVPIEAEESLTANNHPVKRSLKSCDEDDKACKDENKQIQAENDKIDADAALADGKVQTGDLTKKPSVETKSKVQRIVVRATDKDGAVKRKRHPFKQYGITVTQSTVEKVITEEKFQKMLEKQRDAVAQSAISRQQAQQAHFERQKILAEGETEKARVKMEQEKIQTQKIVSAQTIKEEAEISYETSVIKEKQAKVDANALIIRKKAEAEGKKVVMQADGALEQKLAALVQINQAWANAASHNAMVPSTVVGGNSTSGTSSADFMSLMTAMAAKQVSVDVGIRQ